MYIYIYIWQVWRLNFAANVTARNIHLLYFNNINSGRNINATVTGKYLRANTYHKSLNSSKYYYVEKVTLTDVIFYLFFGKTRISIINTLGSLEGNKSMTINLFLSIVIDSEWWASWNHVIIHLWQQLVDIGYTYRYCQAVPSLNANTWNKMKITKCIRAEFSRKSGSSHNDIRKIEHISIFIN